MKDSIPAEYKIVVDKLFSQKGNPGDKAFLDFAEALGIVQSYKQLAGAPDSSQAFKDFLSLFEENFGLLVAKTWVEKDEEELKDKLQWRLPGFVEKVKKGDYASALVDFSSIIGELAHLLFGAQSQQDDFADYSFRIEPHMGLFFWYGFHLGAFFESGDDTARAALFLGLCYITDF